MKRFSTMVTVLVFISVFLLSACGHTDHTLSWQEQYDLGVRYLSEGNYEEAIIAFTAAIEIDPKQVDAYIGLADVYEAQGDIEQAIKVLRDGLEVTGDPQFSDRINGLEQSAIDVDMNLLENCPYVGARENWRVSAEQASAFSKVIDNAVLRAEREIVPDDYDLDFQGPAVFATLFDVDGSTALLICGLELRDIESWCGPCGFEYDDSLAYPRFTEVWEWDGNTTVEVPLSETYSDYVYVSLWSDGIEFFTLYNGTDLDGEAWDTKFSYSNGRIATTPAYCSAWAMVYDYKTDMYNIPTEGQSNMEIGRTYMQKLISDGDWPSLSFDWSKMAEDIDMDDGFRISINWDWDHITNTSELVRSTQPGGNSALLCIGDIASNDSAWGEASSVSDVLKSFSQT